MLDHVWWAAWPFVTAFVFVASVTGSWSLYRASFEQRQSLVIKIGLLEAEELQASKFRFQASP